MNFYKFFLISLLIFLCNCSSNNKNFSKQFLIDNQFSNKGFALVFDENLYEQNIISKKIDNRSYIIFHRNLKKNSNVKITNLQ